MVGRHGAARGHRDGNGRTGRSSYWQTSQRRPSTSPSRTRSWRYSWTFREPAACLWCWSPTTWRWWRKPVTGSPSCMPGASWSWRTHGPSSAIPATPTPWACCVRFRGSMAKATAGTNSGPAAQLSTLPPGCPFARAAVLQPECRVTEYLREITPGHFSACLNPDASMGAVMSGAPDHCSRSRIWWWSSRAGAPSPISGREPPPRRARSME